MHTAQTVRAYLEKKHPGNFYISTSASNHCVLGYISDGFVETENEKLQYSTDKAGRVRLVNRTALTPTYKSVRLQAKDCVVRVAGNGPYAGKYVKAYKGEGWLELVDSAKECNPQARYNADQNRAYVAFHSQYCYGGQFEVVTI